MKDLRSERKKQVWKGSEMCTVSVIRRDWQ